MSSTVDAPPTAHPIRAFARRLHAVLDQLVDAPTWSMTTDEQRAVLVELARGRARLDELALRVLAEGDRADIAADSAATSTAAWLAHAVRQPVGAAHADVKLAAALDGELGATRAALAAGVVDTERARVVVRAVETLPPEVVAADPTLPQRAERHLLDLAADHDAKTLQRLARHVLDVVDPEAADERLGKQLEAEESAAARATYLQLHDNGDGTHTGHFKIADLHAAMLTKALEAFTTPTHRGAVATGADTMTETAVTPAPRLTRPELLGHAFGELIERLDPQRLPRAGGCNASVVVLLDYDTLLSGLGTAGLDTGQRISAAAARRLACQAGIIPVVYQRALGGRSVVLDMGRKVRLHTEQQRIALAVEQGGCTAAGCSRPAAWCQAHHDLPWSRGGATSVRNGRLLCPFHHRRAHSATYDMQHLPDGAVRFHRRP